jgi:hypothetical protein
VLFYFMFQSNGVKKVRLVPSMDVFLSQQQISQALLAAGGKPRKLVLYLLDSFFSREILGKSSAKGARNAHNASVQTKALPQIVVGAVKEFVLRTFRKEGGEACMMDKEFNDVINSKCATARRSLLQEKLL